MKAPGGADDVRIEFGDGKVWRLWGRDGAAREIELAGNVPGKVLPVLLGSGLGVCLERLLKRGPVAVVDREAAICEATGVRERYADHPDVLWLDFDDPEDVLATIRIWRAKRGLGDPAVVVLPLYQRLGGPYYGALREAVEARSAMRGRLAYPRFQSESPRVLVLGKPYFLTGEIESALVRLGVERRTVEVGTGATVREGFLNDLLTAAVEFRPDFLLTVNHFGLDCAGRLAGLLDDLGLPLASWFVDNPQLILSRYRGLSTPRTALFTWDRAGMDSLGDMGFANVCHLPLATDPARFRPGIAGREAWRAQVSFVGNSMVERVRDNLAVAVLPESLAEDARQAAIGFGASGVVSAAEYLASRWPKLHVFLEEVSGLERKLALESYLTFEATRQYRLSCVRELLPFDPLIVGDEHWPALLGEGARFSGAVDYYHDLPRFYPMSDLNFNCTSMQMRGAVNQRVFDVPACGGFVLTDRREELFELFEPDSEVACFDSPGDVADQVARWLDDPEGRAAVSERARKRILAEHTYEHRLRKLMVRMRQCFA